MPTEPDSRVDFETPERSERLQLVTHLLNSAEAVPYLRAPSGAGKTHFAQRLAQALQEDFTLVSLGAAGLGSVASMLSAEFDLEPGQSDWAAVVTELAGPQPLLVLIDDADQLTPQALAELGELHDRGARLLFAGLGGLPPAVTAMPLQYVDLPPFTEDQSLAFLAAAGGDLDKLGEPAARGLHRAADGWPGHLLNALTAIPREINDGAAPAAPSAAQPGTTGAAISLPKLIGGLVLLALLVAGLLMQDRINAWFVTQPEASGPGPLTPAQPIDRLDPAPAQPRPPETAQPQTGAKDSEPTPEATQPEPEQAPQPGDESRVESSPVPQTVAPSVGTADVDTRTVPEAKSAATVEPQAAPAKPVTTDRLPDDKAPDDVLDAVIDAAIAAAAQPPAGKAPVGATASTSGGQAARAADTRPEAATQAKQTAVEAPSRPKPRAVPEVPVKPQAAPQTGSRQAPPPPVRDKSALRGLVWLKSQPPGSYTLQLVGAREPAAIAKFVERHRVATPYAVFARDLGGRPWYSLVAGSYPNRDSAVAARSALPAKLNRKGVWPRTFASIREQMTD